MPIKERVHTGGTKEFVYTDEDRKRIESEDTEYTREFKDALRAHRNKKFHQKIIDKVVPKKKKVPHYHREYIAPRHYEKEHQEKPKKIKKSKKKSDKSPLIVLIVIILGIIFLYYYNQYIIDGGILDEAEIGQPIFEESSVKISFIEYLNSYKDYDDKKATLTGFLSRGIKKLGSGGVYVEYIEDDFNNGITLLNLKKEQISLFPKTGTTKELYNVTGKFKRKYKGLDFQVTEIIKTERQKILIKKDLKLKETTTPILIEEDKVKELNFTKLFDVIRQITNIDCKEGERRYKTQCIPIITCSDGTLHPECSKNKPKQCLNGTLINNAIGCGCPSDYKVTGNSCEKIKRCKDSTIYGKCSKEKPYYCYNGDLVESSDRCGCKYGFVAKDDKCVSRDIIESQEATEYVNKLRKPIIPNPIFLVAKLIFSICFKGNLLTSMTLSKNLVHM